MNRPEEQDNVQALRSLTPARVWLGRAGGSIPTAARLRLRLDHARARDAIRSDFDRDHIVAALASAGCSSFSACSAATSREEYIRRPDLGRVLSDESRALLDDNATDSCDLAIVLCDGLSPGAVEQHGATLAAAIASNARLREWSIGAITVVSNGRVAIGDDIGATLRARLVVVVIGERPGLSVSESIGAYLTFDPRPGRSDAERNCVSNIHDRGLSIDEAARRIVNLIVRAELSGLTGVNLKDDELLLVQRGFAGGLHPVVQDFRPAMIPGGTTMEMDQYEHGVPSWIDVSSGDPEATATFFTELWGWDCPVGPAEFGGYRSCTLNGRTVAGIGPKMDPNMPTVWTSYVNVDSAAEVQALVEANGGMVIAPPMEIGTLGQMAIFADPAGSVFGVWQAGEHLGAGIVNEPGAFSWNELVTDDVDGSKAFYGAVFGWGAHTQGTAGPDAYTEWQLSDRSIAGMMAKRPEMAGVPNHWMVYFSVADTDAAVARITELGGSVMMPPMDIEPGRFAVVAEPSGAAFSVITFKAM